MIDRFQGEYRWLSNFWPAEVVLDGETYPTVEHAYQAAKLDHEARKVVRQAKTPGEAKRIAHRFVPVYGWEASKVAVMRELLRQKFAIPELRERLLATGNEELVEGNTWGDTFWGVDTRIGRGKNTLGKLLMEIRAKL